MTNYAQGHYAEQVAADYLRTKGYSILALNWRHARAEIDIIAQQQRRFLSNGPVVFFEVKYRKTDSQGGGFDYITPKKLEQMRFAAELWTAEHAYTGVYELGAIELTGTEPRVTTLLESLD